MIKLLLCMLCHLHTKDNKTCVNRILVMFSCSPLMTHIDKDNMRCFITVFGIVQ
jgi:hypothetical protein